MNPWRHNLSTAAVWLALATIPPHVVRAGPQTGLPEHRILLQYRTTYGDSWNISYWVRVERYPTVLEMKKLVCAVVAEEKPGDYGRLSISFNYRLESYDLVPTDESTKSWLGRYAWTKTQGGNPYSLFRKRDENGEPLPRSVQFSSFDHTKECPIEEDSSSGSDPGGEK